MLAPIVRAAVASTLVVGVAITAIAAAPRVPPADRGQAVGAAATAIAAAPRVPPADRGQAVGAAATAIAADPAITDAPPTPVAAAAGQDGGDLRSSGEGAGLAGSPLLAIGAVLAIGAGSAAAALLYVRLTAGRGGRA